MTYSGENERGNEDSSEKSKEYAQQFNELTSTIFERRHRVALANVENAGLDVSDVVLPDSDAEWVYEDSLQRAMTIENLFVRGYLGHNLPGQEDMATDFCVVNSGEYTEQRRFIDNATGKRMLRVDMYGVLEGRIVNITFDREEDGDFPNPEDLFPQVDAGVNRLPVDNIQARNILSMLSLIDKLTKDVLYNNAPNHEDAPETRIVSREIAQEVAEAAKIYMDTALTLESRAEELREASKKSIDEGRPFRAKVDAAKAKAFLLLGDKARIQADAVIAKKQAELE